jgi:hypothetical protein
MGVYAISTPCFLTRRRKGNSDCSTYLLKSKQIHKQTYMSTIGADIKRGLSIPPKKLEENRRVEVFLLFISSYHHTVQCMCEYYWLYTKPLLYPAVFHYTNVYSIYTYYSANTTVFLFLLVISLVLLFCCVMYVLSLTFYIETL